MTIYIILLLLLFFVSLRGIGKAGMLLFILILSVILGFREENVGVDTINYVSYYNETSGILDGYMEKGWNTLIVLCKLFSLSAYGCHFIVALLTFIPFYLIMAEFRDNYVNGYILFFLYSLCFYFLMFNGMRQLLSISIVLMGFQSLNKGRTALFFVWIIIASFIHLSSLLALSVYFIPKIRFTPNRVVLLLSVSFIMGLFLGEAFFVAVSGKYAHDVEYGLRTGVAYVMIVGLLTNLFTLWLYFQHPDLDDNFWIKCNILSVVVLNVLSNLIIGPRIVYIFSVTSIIAFSLYLRYSSNVLLHVVSYLYALVMFAKFMLPELLMYGLDGSLIPYRMNFQPFM